MNAPADLSAGVKERESLRRAWQRLHEFCAAHEWRGYDPYDGLNSPLARILPGKVILQTLSQRYCLFETMLRNFSLTNISPLRSLSGHYLWHIYLVRACSHTLRRMQVIFAEISSYECIVTSLVVIG